MKVTIIVGSTRQGRMGARVGKWVEAYATKQEGWDVTVADLAELKLPMYEGPGVPVMSGKVYADEAVSKWSKIIDTSDAFVFVTAEYNHGLPAPLKNALDLLYPEWGNKVAGIVSYSMAGTGGVRAAEQLRLVAAHLGLATTQTATAISSVHEVVSEDGITTEEGLIATLTTELTQVDMWGKALKSARLTPEMAE